MTRRKPGLFFMSVEFVESIHSVSAHQWNALLDSDYPFARHEFLAALEDSGSTGPERGWSAQHALVWDGDRLQAIMPLYLKDHSFGEYVFDWGWANAYAQHGYDYYPKLTNAIPFTPCQGPRLLGRHDEALIADLSRALADRCETLNASGWHCLFPEMALSQSLARLGEAPQRMGCQFHWYNPGYADFEDFLARMTSRKRKNIRKERRAVEGQGFRFRVKEGKDIHASDWDLFYGLYQLTYLKRSGHGGYLEPGFFHRLGETLSEHCVMICAENEDRTLAASLFFKDRDTLYGRYWGCRAEFDFLHFETCYYQGIDYAIEQGLNRFDGGAQGEHKVARGFEPVLTYSNHWLAEPLFREPVHRFLSLEAKEIHAYMDEVRRHSPYRNAEP